MFYYIDSVTGLNQSEPVPVRFFWNLDVPRTGPVRGSSPEGSRTGNGPDFKALMLVCGIVGKGMAELNKYGLGQVHVQ